MSQKQFLRPDDGAKVFIFSEFQKLSPARCYKKLKTAQKRYLPDIFSNAPFFYFECQL